MIQHAACEKSIQEHPCYSEEASHRYARLHLPVAPACNIQCRYCHRKFDCANESRPGVVSALLTPEQAALRVDAAVQQLPQLKVIGFAGPGDPLANRERVFATCRTLLSSHAGLQLCLSTNGLVLPESVDAIIAHGIRHVTITVNALDPAIGARIYSWIFWRRRRRYGVEAARILIEQQLAGMAALIARGVLVKINTVLIPDFNDEEVARINQLVSRAGVFSHNVMPLISAPEHGTCFGRMGVMGPSEARLNEVRGQCAGSARLMTHCRQCRADAVGLLGEDDASLRREHSRVIPILQGARPAGEAPILLAVASSDGRLVDLHFGHARSFQVYRVHESRVEFVEERSVAQFCLGDDTCVEERSAIAGHLEALRDCRAVICSRIGYTPWEALLARGVEPVNRHASRPVVEAVWQTALRLRDPATRDRERQVLAG